MQLNHPGTLESRMRGNVPVRFGKGLSEKERKLPRREPTSSFKRAAVKFGVARYLYRDGVPAYPGAPQGPSAAVAEQAQPASAGPEAHTPAPRTGRALFAWAKEQEQRYEVSLLKHLNGWAKAQEFPARMLDWDADQVSRGYAEACRKLHMLRTGHSEAYEKALAN